MLVGGNGRAASSEDTRPGPIGGKDRVKMTVRDIGRGEGRFPSHQTLLR